MCQFCVSSSREAQTTPTKPLTIETLFQPGGLAGRGPETMEWSPDGTKLSFVQRDEKGEKGELWYVDAATGEKKVLVSAAKLASLDPDVNKVKNEREKERLTRYHVAAYLWAPDSKHLMFDSQGQLWLYDLGSETAVQFTSASDPSGDPKFSPDGNRVAYVRKHNLYVRPVDGQRREAAHQRYWRRSAERRYRLGLCGRARRAQQLFLVARQQRDRHSCTWTRRKVPTYPITDWMPTHPTVDPEKYPKVGDPNPVVKLGVVDADKGKVRWISLTSDEDTYIPRFGWVSEGVIWAEVLNRTEDKLDLYFVDAKSGKSRLVLTEATPGAWIDFEHLEVQFLKSKPQFLWPSWRDGNMHIYLYSFDKQNPMAPTPSWSGNWSRATTRCLESKASDEGSGTVFLSSE